MYCSMQIENSFIFPKLSTFVDYCTMYLDASGDHGLPPPYGKSRTAWYSIAGMIMTPEQDSKAKDFTVRILKKYISNEMKLEYPSKYELHYVDLLHGNNIYEKLESCEKKKMADELFDYLLELKPVIVAISINKLKFKEKYGDDALDIKSLAIRSLLDKFSMYMEEHNMIGMAVWDEEAHKNDIKLREDFKKIRQSGVKITGYYYQPTRNSKLENILNTILFCPSDVSPGIQCVDFIVHSIWNHREKNKSNRYDQIEPLWICDEYAANKDTVFPK
ncbi:MAG: DUF3800 domain-containing protein [Nitrosopumilus sp. D6]|nr:MAG: DUF3800 domain-containing protein [Nitrosopumilus sp. D6]